MAAANVINAKLEEDCLKDQNRCADRQQQTIGDRLLDDLDAFNRLPPALFEACEVQSASVSSISLVRYRCSDYSVPTTCGLRKVTVKGFVDEVVIFNGSEEIARHSRSYNKYDFVYNPLHYLALLERKPSALDQAAPLQDWQLPPQFEHLRRLMEARMATNAKGKREFIQVLRLMELFDEAVVAEAVSRAIQLGTISFDAVKQLVVARVERRPANLDLDAYPHLPQPQVQATRAADYSALTGGMTA